MFINLTNHPSSGWNKEQLEAARHYGEIVELPFPIIKPTFTKNDILHLVKDSTDVIMGIKDVDTVVHVMGEMTFTHALVSRLKAQGIRCVASTTERHVRMEADGTKVSEFRFVQFREY